MTAPHSPRTSQQITSPRVKSQFLYLKTQDQVADDIKFDDFQKLGKSNTLPNIAFSNGSTRTSDYGSLNSTPKNSSKYMFIDLNKGSKVRILEKPFTDQDFKDDERPVTRQSKKSGSLPPLIESELEENSKFPKIKADFAQKKYRSYQKLKKTIKDESSVTPRDTDETRKSRKVTFASSLIEANQILNPAKESSLKSKQKVRLRKTLGKKDSDDIMFIRPGAISNALLNLASNDLLFKPKITENEVENILAQEDPLAIKHSLADSSLIYLDNAFDDQLIQSPKRIEYPALPKLDSSLIFKTPFSAQLDFINRAPNSERMTKSSTLGIIPRAFNESTLGNIEGILNGNTAHIRNPFKKTSSFTGGRTKTEIFSPINKGGM